MCPKGNDPFKSYTDYRTIQIVTEVLYGTIQSGTFKFTFNGEYFFFSVNANSWNATACQESFENLNNIKKELCVQTGLTSTYTATYAVSFVQFPFYPHENNIYSNNGNPAISDFSCDTTFVVATSGAAISCTITDLVYE